jgi:osmoprotectant transport system ATP-binding protein
VKGAAVELRDVAVRYDDATAVRGVDLSVPSGALVTIVGPSGCGKSTLLRTINRLVPIERGSISIDGVDSATLDPVELRRSIGYAIQAIGLFAHMTVAKNIAVVPELLGWDRERIRAQVDRMIELVGLDPAQYRDRRPAQLSGGQAQRVGVARALAGEPRLLLMDEPFGAVDAIARRSLQNELLGIVRESGATTILVTHDVNESLHLSDRIVVMREGRIVQDAAPSDILAHPADAFVADLFAEDAEIAALRERARNA